jgi:serine protease AprX
MRSRFGKLIALMSLILIPLSASGATQAKPHVKVSRDLLNLLAAARGSDLVDVIVQGEGSSLPRLRAKAGNRGAAAVRDLALVNGFVATLAAGEIQSLADEPGVVRISPDRLVASTMDVAALASSASWTRSPAPAAAGPTGRGVVVAVIDSGIYPHEDLGPDGIVATVDFVDSRRSGSPMTADPYGHGTHIAGIIAGRPLASPLGGGFFGGIASGSRLVSLRVLDHRGLGKSSDVIAALAWCVQHRSEYGIRIVNLSLGQPVAEPAALDPLAQAVEKAWQAGLVVVASAGNSGMVATGYGMISSPGNDPRIITAGALDDHDTAMTRDDAVAGFSSRGPTRFDLILKPDVVAPGVNIISLRSPLSTLDRMMPAARVSGNQLSRSPAFEPRYFEMSGSSMAAALVSGAAALMLEVDPTLTPDDVKARLMRHADHAASQDIYTRGAGAIDIASTLAGVERASAAASPAVHSDGTMVTIAETGPMWGDATRWGLDEIYGDPALWGEQVPETLSLFDDPCITGEGITWQGVGGQGITWQGISGEGITWQGVSGEGITWQGLTGDGITWQGLEGGGITWQGVRGRALTWQTSSAGGSCSF